LTVIVNTLGIHGSNSHALTRMPVQSTWGCDMCALSTPGATSWTMLVTTSVDNATRPSRWVVDTAESSNLSDEPDLLGEDLPCERVNSSACGWARRVGSP
jgi:hypothetical protein